MTELVQTLVNHLHDVAAEAVLHDALKAAPGDALQQAVISFLCIRLCSQHSRNERLQCLPADKKTLAVSTRMKG